MSKVSPEARYRHRNKVKKLSAIVKSRQHQGRKLRIHQKSQIYLQSLFEQLQESSQQAYQCDCQAKDATCERADTVAGIYLMVEPHSLSPATVAFSLKLRLTSVTQREY